MYETISVVIETEGEEIREGLHLSVSKIALAADRPNAICCAAIDWCQRNSFVFVDAWEKQ